MTNLTNQISGFAMLALAALPMAALATNAYAAPVPASVKVGDLNLTTEEGLDAFEQRANFAARRFCRAEASLSARAACRKGVRAELNEKMVAVRTAQMTKSASTFAAR